MDAQKCEAFLTAVDLGSFTSAADNLGYTQSGITRMIRGLEEELGFSLFIRSKHGVVLTENGKIMLPLCRNVVNATKQAEEAGEDIRGTLRGSLGIGCYYSISSMVLPRILKEFNQKYPGVHVRMREGGNLEMAQWLNERSVDICFCAQPKNTSCDWIRLFQDEIVVWLPWNHELANASAYPVKRLESEPFIHTQPERDTDLDRLLEKLNLHPDAVFSTSDAFTAYNMVSMGLGISFNQRLITRKWMKQVREISFDPPQFVSLGLAVPSLKNASPAARKFIKMATEEAKNLS